jgi:hypothetical protein
MTIIDFMFVFSGVVFHLVIAGIYVASKRERLDLARKLGYIVIAMALPVFITLVSFWVAGRSLQTLLSLAAIILYISLEFVLDFILKIEFREKPAIHIPYIVVFYAACFSYIGVSFSIDRTWGYVVSASFWIVLATLIYLLRGGKKRIATN